jgi:hypothetical protein
MSRVVVLLNHSVVGLRAALRATAAVTSFLSNIAKFVFLPALLSLLLSACAVEGDFGRPRATVFTKITDEVLLNTNIITRGLTWPEFTRDEAVLREAGHRLARPLHTETNPSNISYGAQNGGYGTGPWVYNSESPLLSVARDIDADHHALTQFGHSAHRVLVSDSQRLDTLLKRDPGLRAKQRDGARARLQENFDYIESVFMDFGGRLRAYHYAIEDVRTHEPDMVVGEVRGSLDHLRDRAASIKYELTNYYRAAMARSDARPPRPERDRVSRHDRLSYRQNPDQGVPYMQPPTNLSDKPFK